MITADRLREVLDYNRETGVFTWKVTLSNRAAKGQRVGSDTKSGHLTVRIDKKTYLLHRLAWLYVTGKWPEKQIDHINRIANDNRFSNLREASASQNKWNEGLHSNNMSGVRGVSWDKVKMKWVARATINGRIHVIGYFDLIHDAAAAYRAKVSPVAGEFAYCDGWVLPQ